MEIREFFKKPFRKEEKRQYFPYIQQAWTSGIFSNSELNNTVDACISRICNTMSILPIGLYQYTKKGVQEAWWENLYNVLKNPSVEESYTLFMKTLVRCLLTRGNASLYKGFDGNNVSYLQIVDPTKVMVGRDNYGRKTFAIEGTVYTEDKILHIPYFGEGYNGDVGKSPLEVHKGIIQQNDYLHEYVSLYFKQGIGSKLLVTLGDDFKPSKQNLNQLVQEMNEYYRTTVAGNENAGMPIITPPGTTIGKLEMCSNVQSEVDKLLSKSDANICRMFNIPPEIIISSENKYNSLEQKNADYLQSCIQPLAQHIAEYLNKLIPVNQRGNFFVMFSYNNLLETDIEKKQNRLMNAYHGGLITLSEFRKEMNLPSISNSTEANTKWIPANLIPLTEGNINSIMAKSKLAYSELEDKDFGGHSLNGMDKAL